MYFDDQTAELTLDPAELCASLGLQPTAENIALVEAGAVEGLMALRPTASVTFESEMGRRPQ
jgi:hypothetical protein